MGGGRLSTKYEEVEMQDDPLAPASTQFALARTTPPPDGAGSEGGVRPWGLRHCTPGLPADRDVEWGYDHARQIGVDGTGRPMLDVMGPAPTAPTTTKVDGQDPPSAEDWIND